MSESKQSKDNVVHLETFRRKSGEAEGAQESAWEQTTQPLLPGEKSSDQPIIHITKVSSGFGRLHVPAWRDTVRSMAA